MTSLWPGSPALGRLLQAARNGLFLMFFCAAGVSSETEANLDSTDAEGSADGPEAVVLTPYKLCMLQLVESASNVLTAGQLRNYCSLQSTAGSGVSSERSPLRQRIALEQYSLNNPFSLLPNRPNYILPLAYLTDPDPINEIDNELLPIEVEFQLSLKVVILETLYRELGSLSFAYTTRSFWQAYNVDQSTTG